MSFLKHIRNRLANSLKKNLSLAIYSVIIAIISWFVISMTLYPSIPKTIENIPLDIDITGTSAAENGLSVISCDIDSVDVQIRGNRAQIGNLSSDNLKASIVADNVTSAGTKTLAIEITCKDKNIAFEVQSKSPETATVVFDKYDTREFPVTPEIPNITFAEGIAIDTETYSCEPDVISITGPSAQLDKIAKCVAVSNKEISLDSSYTVASDEIKLYSEDGAVLDQSSLKLNTSNLLINIPVMTQKTVGLSVGITGAPPNFDTSVLNFNLSADSITIASKNSKLAEIPDTLEIGKVILSELDIGYTKTFTIDLKDYINVSNLESVTVTLDDSGLARKELSLSQDQLSVSNAPNDNYDYSVLTKKLDIAVVGPTDIIDDITASDILADANLLGADIPQGESFSYGVTISCPNHSNVWAVTNSKITIQKSEKTTTGTSDPEESTESSTGKSN